MKWLFFLISFTFLFDKTALSQRNSMGKYTLSTQPLQFLFKELPIVFQRNYKNASIGMLLAYRFDSKLSRNPAPLVSYYLEESRYAAPRYKAITIGLSGKYYLWKGEMKFIEGQIFYRNWWFRDRYYEEIIKTQITYAIASYDAEVWGGKILVGETINFSKNKKSNFVLTYFLGIGLRQSWYSERGIQSHGSTLFSSRSGYTEYNSHVKTNITVSPQLGISIGYLFKSHKKVE